MTLSGIWRCWRRCRRQVRKVLEAVMRSWSRVKQQVVAVQNSLSFGSPRLDWNVAWLPLRLPVLDETVEELLGLLYRGQLQ